MLQFLFDTDHLTLFDHSDLKVWRSLRATGARLGWHQRGECRRESRGRLAALAKHQGGLLQVQAYRRLIESLQLFQHFPVVAFDVSSEAAISSCAACGSRLAARTCALPQSLWCINWSWVTRNRRDFAQVPGLKLEDWSV